MALSSSPANSEASDAESTEGSEPDLDWSSSVLLSKGLLMVDFFY